MIRVLILDDDALFAGMLADFLNRREGGKFRAVPTTTADEALAQAAAPGESLDAFLIDQRLGPGLDGIDVMTELRKHHPDAEAVIFANDPHSGRRA
jgi:DNA-binding NarL/FixJ family response regulator